MPARHHLPRRRPAGGSARWEPRRVPVGGDGLGRRAGAGRRPASAPDVKSVQSWGLSKQGQHCCRAPSATGSEDMWPPFEGECLMASWDVVSCVRQGAVWISSSTDNVRIRTNYRSVLQLLRASPPCAGSIASGLRLSAHRARMRGSGATSIIRRVVTAQSASPWRRRARVLRCAAGAVLRRARSCMRSDSKPPDRADAMEISTFLVHGAASARLRRRARRSMARSSVDRNRQPAGPAVSASAAG